jgi:phosphoenolpyruvate carboxykinase (ATP)
MKIAYTRAMVHAVLDGSLDGVSTRVDPVFGLTIPNAVPSVPVEVLDPRGTWPDPAGYDVQAKKLAAMFRENFEKFGSVAESIRAAGPAGE